MVEFKFPDVGEGIHEGELVRWLVKVGDVVKEHQAIAEVETDKAVVELPSPVSGKVVSLNVNPGQTIKVGDVIAVIGDGKPMATSLKPKTENLKPKTDNLKPKTDSRKAVSIVGELSADERELPAHVERKVVSSKSVMALPSVRKLALEKGIDLSTIKGSGPGGRILESDLKVSKSVSVESKEQLSGPKVSFDDYGKIIRIPLRGVRKAISNNMQVAWSIPHVTHLDEADVTQLVKVREKEKKDAQRHGIKLTFLPYVTKAVIAGLRQFRYLNSSFAESEIITKQYFNIGFAVDAPDGLIVPVLRNCDQRTLLNIAEEMALLASKARERKLSLDELRGGTFTITNIGSYGGLGFTPIINSPQVAILGLGRIYDAARVVNGKIVVRKVLPLGLSFDHRVVDGAMAAKFVNIVKEQLESPKLIVRGMEKGLTQ